ncbi:MAG TPA: M20/M25/M40 family metallo-hydrolase [Polyangia bacterium]|nr:M20/M25/M40 family metallo-hydrolase [Polyangia bacterium]
MPRPRLLSYLLTATFTFSWPGFGSVPAAQATAPPGAGPPAADASGVEAEARAILEELLVVDTSAGDETKALKPLAERFRQAGVAAELIESAPGRGNLIARLKSTSKKPRRPLLLLAHIDVVPTAGQPWTSSPFQPVLRDGYLVARGVADDKSMAASIAAVALDLARTRAPLGRDVIVALTAGEETGGDAGVRWLLAHRRELLDAELALNEGGALLLDEQGERVVSVQLQAAEKSYQSYQVTARAGGGHSSVPDAATDPVTRLSRALVRLGEFRFPAHVEPSVRDEIARLSTVEAAPLGEVLRRVAAAPPAAPIAPADEALLAADRRVNALTHTTCVATMLAAAPQDNVLPTSASATINCRILPSETREGTLATLRRVLGDDKLEIQPLSDIGVAPPSPAGGVVSEAVRRVAARMFPEARVVHTMGLGASDSRHLRGVGVAAYGIATAPATPKELFTAHGPDERRRERWLAPGTRFFRELVRELTR